MSEMWLVRGRYCGYSSNDGLVSWRKRLKGWRLVNRTAGTKPAIIQKLSDRYDGGSLNRKVPPQWAREMAAAYRPAGMSSVRFRARPMILHHHDGHMDGGPIGRTNRET